MSQTVSKFPDDKIADLIESVECRPFLYDIKNKLHRNTNYSTNAWNEISIEVGVPAILCKARWTTLRNYYNEIRNRILESESGDKRSKWQHYDRMSFLNEHLGIHHLHHSIRKASSESSNNNFPRIIDKCSTGDNSFDSLLSKLTNHNNSGNNNDHNDNNKECLEPFGPLNTHHHNEFLDSSSTSTSTRPTTFNLIVQRPSAEKTNSSADGGEDDSIYFFLKSILPRIKSLPKNMQHLFMLETMTNLMKFEQQVEENDNLQ